jgi:murein DD-endopeptidase MepM/ murein hydrolase activator NlpD
MCCFFKVKEKTAAASLMFLKLNFLIILFFTSWSITYADTVAELKEKIEERNASIKALEAEIKTYQNELSKINKESNSLQNAIKSLDLSRKKLNADIGITENQISKVNLELTKLSLEIKTQSESINNNLKAMAESIRKINEADDNDLISLMLTVDSLSDFTNEVDQQKQLQTAVAARLVVLKSLKANLENTEIETKRKKAELVLLKDRLTDQKRIVEINKKEKDALLAATKSRESVYLRILKEKLALKEAFERELLEFESTLQFVIDQTKLPPPGSGVLKSPLDEFFVTQYFGYTDFAIKNPNVYNGKGHNGIDLRASVGASVKAALAGKVVDIGDTDLVCPNASYGKWILINHNNGLSTLYAHLSLIKVSPGQTVKTGELIGYSGNSGYSTGPHLHFTVYATDGVRVMERPSRVCGGVYRMPVADLKAYLNPLSYLK